MQPLTNVPNTNMIGPEEALKKISSYLQTLKQEVEYNIQNAEKTGGSTSKTDLLGLFSELGITEQNISYWNRIKQITDDLGNIIGSKIDGNIDNANILISSLKEKNILLMDGTDITNSTWCMELSAAGFRIASEKTYDETTDTYSWVFRTFGTGAGFTADEITAGEINGLTVKACDIVAGNMTSGTIKGVKLEGNEITGNAIRGGSIIGSTIQGNDISGGTITGATIQGNTISGGTISGTEINAATVNASTFNTSVFNAPTISAGIFTGGTFQGGEFIGNVIRGSEIYGGIISGAIVQSVSENGGGVVVKDNGYGIYADTAGTVIVDPETGETVSVPGEGELAGLIYYDTSGAGTPEEAAKRVFIGTENGYAAKIYSDANMSIEAKGEIFIKGNVRFNGTTNLGLQLSESIEWKDNGCIIDGEYYLKITDTQIKCLNTNEVVAIYTSAGTIEDAYAAKSSS